MANTNTGMNRIHCFVADYTDECGVWRNTSLLTCAMLPYQERSIEDDIEHVYQCLTAEGNTVKAIAYIPGLWTPQQLRDMIDGTLALPSGTKITAFDMDGIS